MAAKNDLGVGGQVRERRDVPSTRNFKVEEAKKLFSMAIFFEVFGGTANFSDQ